MKNDKSNLGKEQEAQKKTAEKKTVVNGEKKATTTTAVAKSDNNQKSNLVVKSVEAEPEFISQLEAEVNSREELVESQLAKLEADSSTEASIIRQKANSEATRVEQKAETKITKLQHAQNELQAMKALIAYYGSASQAVSLLEGENATVRISISITNGERSERLESTKVDTAKEVLEMFRNSAENRIRGLVSANVEEVKEQ